MVDSIKLMLAAYDFTYRSFGSAGFGFDFDIRRSASGSPLHYWESSERSLLLAPQIAFTRVSWSLLLELGDFGLLFLESCLLAASDVPAFLSPGFCRSSAPRQLFQICR